MGCCTSSSAVAKAKRINVSTIPDSTNKTVDVLDAKRPKQNLTVQCAFSISVSFQEIRGTEKIMLPDNFSLVADSKSSKAQDTPPTVGSFSLSDFKDSNVFTSIDRPRGWSEDSLNEEISKSKHRPGRSAFANFGSSTGNAWVYRDSICSSSGESARAEQIIYRVPILDPISNSSLLQRRLADIPNKNKPNPLVIHSKNI